MRSYLFLMCIFMQAGLAWALDPGKPIAQYQLAVWQAKDGLPQSTITAILQAKDGYLWLGTQEGLVRFDGVRFTVFDKTTTPSLNNHHILSLAEDGEGVLWIGTNGGGVIRMDHGDFKAYTTREGLSSNTIFSLWPGGDGRLWIGTEGGGLCSLQGEKIHVYTQADGFAGRTVRAICGNGAGVVWIGTEGTGLFRYGEGRFSSYTVRDGLPDARISSLCVEGETLWIGTFAGLAILRSGKIERPGRGQGPADSRVRSLYLDRSGALWVGTNKEGIFRREPGGFSSYSSKDGLPSGFISSILEDREGNLWLGMAPGGLVRLADGKCTVFTVREGLPNNEVRTVLESRDGGIWLGTCGGLSKYARGVFHNYAVGEGSASTARGQGLAGITVYSLMEDRDGRLWLGTSQGLFLFEQGRITPCATPPELASSAIYTLIEDRQGVLWIGTSHGLFWRQDERIVPYAATPGLTRRGIFVLHEDRQGALWIGTQDGLCRLEHGILTTFTTGNGLFCDTIASLYEDAEGVLWIGTYGGGLNRLQGGTLTSISRKDGLWDDSAFQILEDASGMLWMSSNKGIFCVRRQDLNDYALGLKPAITCGHFGIADGMRSAECTGGTQPAGCLTPDGCLWFPTVEGVVMIDPSRIRRNPVIPPVVIERVVVGKHSVQAGRGAVFPPGRGDVEFQYSALSFTAPDKVLFKYMLEGNDQEWIEAGTRRTAYYTNLPPGRYVFKVKACNNDGAWNEKGAAFSFTLQPHYYQTSIFRATIAGFILSVMASIFWLVHLVRMRVLRAETAVLEERNRIAREIHDTVAQGLSGVVLQLVTAGRVIASNTDVAQEHVNVACNLAKESLDDTRRAIQALRPKALEQTTLPSALRVLAGSMTLGTGISGRLDIQGKPRILSARYEDDLLRIAQEALTNAVRHGKPGQIQISLRYGWTGIQLAITDDGCGFSIAEQDTTSQGYGLKGMRERASQHCWPLVIESTPGSGSTVRVRVPLLWDRLWRRA